MIGAALTGTYNRAITGSFWTPPYLVHEKQYQGERAVRLHASASEAHLQQPVGAISLRSKRNAALPVPANAAQRDARRTRKLTLWWSFYFGILLSAPLLLIAWIKGGRLRWAQIVVLVAFIATAVFYTQRSIPDRLAIDILAIAQFVILWLAFEDFWPRLALSTIGILLFESFFVKYAFAHYFAPIACLVLFLQVEALKKLWHWSAEATAPLKLTRGERRRANRAAIKSTSPRFPLRGFVTLLPIACFISLVLRVEARANDWAIDLHPPDVDALLTQDWSLQRAELEKWLEAQSGQQLVFVRYFAIHDVDHEWVWNRADLMHAKVVWARDFGSDHNQVLPQQMPNRKVWSLLADMPNPKLVPYSDVLAHAPHGSPPPDDPVFPTQEEP